jgi:hypothetical protein
MIAALCRAVSIVMLIAGAAYAADGVAVIETVEFGDLTMCHSDVFTQSCDLFHHVALPKRLAIGDRVRLSFDVDNKQFSFPVARIIKNGIVCTVLSEASGDPEKIDRIKVPSCMDVTGSR